MKLLTVGLVMLAGISGLDTDAFLQEYAAKRAGVQSLDAAFTQKEFFPDEVVTTQGTLAYRAPKRVLFRTEDPEVTMLVDKAHVYEYEPDIQQVLISELDEQTVSDVFFIAFTDDIDGLKKRYTITVFESEDDRGKRGITLKPKEAEARLFKEVQLYLSDNNLLPWRIRIVQEEGSQQLINVDVKEVNAAPGGQQFGFRAEEGTKVIQDGSVVEKVGAGGKWFPERSETDTDEELVEVLPLNE